MDHLPLQKFVQRHHFSPMVTFPTTAQRPVALVCRSVRIYGRFILVLLQPWIHYKFPFQGRRGRDAVVGSCKFLVGVMAQSVLLFAAFIDSRVRHSNELFWALVEVLESCKTAHKCSIHHKLAVDKSLRAAATRAGPVTLDFLLHQLPHSNTDTWRHSVDKLQREMLHHCIDLRAVQALQSLQRVPRVYDGDMPGKFALKPERPSPLDTLAPGAGKVLEDLRERRQ
mmetsp:Transcript_4272/g.12222  ORF Transcript_4272/g.12222 Transcript_4272/m.12222 type:complete len:226 (-) Transcript_4272:2347-3024(-)